MPSTLRFLVVGLSFVVNGASARMLAMEAPSCVVGQKVPFLDEAGRKPEFAKFRDSLLAAVKGRNVKALSSLVSPGIKFSFGPEGEGRDRFLKHWKLNGAEAGKSPLWDELAVALKRGGHWESNEFHFPYVVKSWPSSCDAYSEYAAVAGADVSVRETADAASPVVTNVGDELVRLPEGISTAPWTKVETAGEKIGFVQSTTLLSPIGRRGSFSQSGKTWQLAVFVAGD